MSFWSKLFGGGNSGESAGAAGGPSEEYKGFTIIAVSMAAGAEHQLAGRIEKEIDGEVKRYDFVRADRFSSRDDATSMTFNKGRQIIDEQGDRLFQQSSPAKPN